MSVTGIIAEFNPLHTGHEYLIKKAKEQGPVVVCISGNFVQRGDTAIADKRVRAKAALLSGADLVLELPVLWSMSTAQNFALGGVSALYFAGCDNILFGSENGDIEKLSNTAEMLASEKFSRCIENELKKGVTFAAARQTAGEMCGCDKEILNKPNNNLGIEYIYAARKNGYNINFNTVTRQGAAHDSNDVDEFVSASLLRQKLLNGDKDFCSRYISKNVMNLLDEDNISDINRIERSILAVLRTRDIDWLKNLPDISEGVENKLFSAIRVAGSLEELYNEIKVKRYTLARIRRMTLSAFIGFDNSQFLKPLPYIRVLGFNKVGEQLIKTRLSNSPVPVVIRTADVNLLSKEGKMVFEIESRATDLFGLSLKKPMECGIEYTSKIIKTE